MEQLESWPFIGWFVASLYGVREWGMGVGEKGLLYVRLPVGGEGGGGHLIGSVRPEPKYQIPIL